MIKGKIKQKLLKEIAKFGNVYLSCQKIGIDKATYYRWKDGDEKFKKLADRAEEMGRENIGEVAEYSLLQNIKEKNQRAIEFALVNISKRYKQDRTTNVIFMHKKDIVPNVPQKTLEDMLDEYTERQSTDTTGTVDSKSEMDKSPVTLPENQRPLNIPDSNSAIQDKKLDNNT
jgi:hypothetical protein